MFNPELDPALLHRTYANGEPFPHLVVDNFLVPETADRIATELETADISEWFIDEHPEQMAKRWMDDLSRLPPTVAEALTYFNSSPALEFFAALTGIPGLIADWSYLGGGVHVTERGGRLGVHADFNLHPNSGLHRRVNALLYLNRQWDPDWRGQLELWPQDLSGAERVIEPTHNRLAVFSITDTAFHGVPERVICPPDRRRLSLALYYYTRERPEEEKAPFHWAAWQRPKVQ
jgi:Rps23 Pro-64 3,4-dihydroxylase Tpa1-like proline 4-hydroxylase